MELPGMPADGLIQAMFSAADPLTTSEMVAVAAVVPVAVPCTVMGYVPGVTALPTRKESKLVVAVELGENDAVTPAGIPDAFRITAPVNGATSVTVMVEVAPESGETVKLDGEAESVKPDDPPMGPVDVTLQAAPLMVNAVGELLVTPFHRPLNPIEVRLPPAGMAPL